MRVILTGKTDGEAKAPKSQDCKKKKSESQEKLSQFGLEKQDQAREEV